MQQEKDDFGSDRTTGPDAVPPPETMPDVPEPGEAAPEEAEPRRAAEPLDESTPERPDTSATQPGAAETPSGPSPEEETPLQKRKKRESRKELLEHLHRKNEKLMELDRQVKKGAQELAAKEDRLLRLAAEYENYRKRTRREWELLQKRANADLIREIVGGIDDFDRALDSLGDAQEGLRDGIKLIHAGLMDILRKAGVSEIEALGAKFDPQYHEAFGEVERDGMEEGHVAEVIRKGYMLHDEVLRPARVIVSRNKA